MTFPNNWDHEITYSVFFSSNGGSSYTEIVSELTTLTYEWNTSKVINGEYIIRVSAIDSEDNVDSDSISIFVDNEVHTLSVPVIEEPIVGVNISQVFLEWDHAVDSEGHSVTYTLHYSTDDGTTWKLIESDITTNSYTWDVSGLPVDNQEYLVKVTASGSEGLKSFDITDESFTLSGETNSSDTLTTTTSTDTGDDDEDNDFSNPLFSPGIGFLIMTFALILPVIKSIRKYKN